MSSSDGDSFTLGAASCNETVNEMRRTATVAAQRCPDLNLHLKERALQEEKAGRTAGAHASLQKRACPVSNITAQT